MPLTAPQRTHAVVTHGGAGGDRPDEDGCVAAARRAESVLRRGAPAVEAAVAAVVHLEDDGRFNAGRGAVIGLDGKTYELSASVMDSEGFLGAVACVRNVRNPIELAAAVARTPHWCLAGEGADRLARRIGLAEAMPDRAKALREHQQTLQDLQGDEPLLPGVENGDFGVTPALMGGVGDTAALGCGSFCGSLGAVGATGIGEAIVRSASNRPIPTAAVEFAR